MTTFSRLLSSFVGMAVLVCLCLLIPIGFFVKSSIDSRVREGIAQRMTMAQNSFDDVYQQHLDSSLHLLVTSSALNEYLLGSEVEKPILRKRVEKRFAEVLGGSYGFETVLYFNGRGQAEIGVTGKRSIPSFASFRLEQPEVAKVTNKLFAALPPAARGAIGAEGPYLTELGEIFFVAGMAKLDPSTGRDGGAIVIVANLQPYFDRLNEIRFFGKNSLWVMSPTWGMLKTPLDPESAFDPSRHLKTVDKRESKIIRTREGVIAFRDFYVTPSSPMLRIAITVPYSLLLKDVTPAMLFFVLLFVGVVLLATGVSFEMARYLTKPLAGLAAAFHNIAKGDFNFRSKVKVTGDLKALIDQFNDMVEQLQQTTVSRDLLLSEIDQRRRAEGTLAQREMTLETITNAAHDAILMMDAEGRISFWNPAAERIFGWTRNEVMGRDMHALLAPARYHESIKKGFPHFQKTGQGAAVGKTLELWGIRKDKSEFPFELALSSIKIDDKWYAVGILRDIAERKKMEVRLSESERRHKALYEMSADAIMLLSGDKFVAGNPASYRLFECKDEEAFLSHTPADFSPEYQPDGVLSSDKASQMMAIAMEKSSHLFEWTHRTERGRDFFASVLLARVEVNGEKMLLATVRDITAQKQAEERLVKQHKFLETILDSLTHPFYVIDANDYRILLANASARALTSADSKGSTCHAISHHSDKPCTGDHICPLEEVKRTKKGVMVEHLHYDAQGNPKQMEVYGYPIFDDAGNVAQMIEYSLDVTERKRIQGELEETHAKLKESVAQLVQAEKLTALGELTAGIAHELNQPLNVTKIICQGILRDIEKNRFQVEEAKADLPQIVTQMNKMAEIINHMRIFTRRTDGSQREKCDLNVVVTDVLRFVTQQFKDQNVGLVKNLASVLPFVLADQIQIEQVVMNLLTNARHAVESGGKDLKRIEIRTAADPNGMVFIEIADNGIGIPEKLKVKMFQQFFTTKEPGKGTGLGLSLCRKILEEHRGTITFESVEGEGTTFRMSLPALPDVKEA